ncbi:Zn-ribbon-containing protein [Chryseobacterium herbae]|uniref:Zn-ribbon-containing protein n=1 Tax=Chryseobacterium herbae TaxID=2976476 RepID=A0ABT2IUH8_9FLAO|nr:Zn-ribbon-containing protein [Chryseobacterium sp. pc1-10]MCT2562494.1 Zn-ribbon-containing protein [Chryseobacterium sp. pc1-10]
MFIQEVSIDINSKVNKDELFQEFNLLMSFYRGNGQTQGRIESQYINKNKIVALPFTLEKKSLDKKNNNTYVTRQIEKIETLSKSSISIKTVGKTLEDYKGGCQCKKSDFFILITTYISIDSPITCGNCNQSVPLYKLPKYRDFGYMPILNWETNYQSCDRLQMNCEVGERWSLNQMQELNSQLSKQGIEICEKLQELTKIPTFYFLYNYRKYKSDQSNRPCPGCGKTWNLKTPHDYFYDFKCEDCKIISTLSPNS